MNGLIPLDTIQARDLSRVGGKAFHLGRLAARGLPVPPGFVVPAEAFRAALAAAGLWEEAERCHLEPDPERVSHFEAAVRAMPVPEALARAVSQAAADLGGRVAVRSSGVDEDGAEKSFAGQHLSVVGIPPGDAAGALRRVWASLYGASALAYRGRRGPPPGGMAVLVQRVIEPESAGVLFTVNPLSGSWHEMVVEAVWGLGEGVVGGQITPHWFLVRRPRRAPPWIQRVLSRVRVQPVQEDLPELTHAWRVGPGGGIEQRPLPTELRGRPVLDRPALVRLCRLGLRVESEIGEPQDVEWAREASGRLWLLQARPITTSAAPRARTDVVWTRRFLGERWSEPATPLGWSLLAPTLEWFIGYPVTQARYLGGGPPLRLVAGRPYLNATVFRHLAFKLPGAPPPAFIMELLPPEEEASFRQRFAVMPDAAVYASILRETAAERRWLRFKWNPLTNHQHWAVFEARLDEVLPALSRPPVSEADAVRLVEAQLGLVREYVGIHVVSLLCAHLGWQLLEGALSAWLPEDAARLLRALGVSAPGNRTLEVNDALWRLSRLADERDLEALGSGAPPDPDRPFWSALGEVLARYGHRADASWEVFAPRWSDDPARLVPVLRAQRQASEAPSATGAAQEAAAQAALAELEARLARRPGRLAALKVLVDLSRKYLLLRENQRFQFDRVQHAQQRTLLWLGGRLAARGALQAGADIRWLSWDEVQGLVQGTFEPPEARRAVEARRRRWEADREEPPVFLVGDQAGAVPPDAARIEALGISPGRVRGRVRIVRTLADGHKLQAGEILVSRAVDPSWTPLFMVAGGVILELGSRLSHGAVVAREYGVPAVVNVEGVFRRFHDGQEVTVDGGRGVIWLHEPGP